MKINVKCQMSNLKSGFQGGFTLIELMVAISIMAVLGTIGIAGFVNYNKVQVLQTSTNEVVTILNLAKSRAQSQIKPSPELACDTLYGYTVGINRGDLSDSSNYTLMVRCGGVDSTPLAAKTLPEGIDFDSSKKIFFPIQTGGVRVTHVSLLSRESERGVGAPLSVGTPSSWDIIVSNPDGKIKTITVNALGGVSVQ